MVAEYSPGEIRPGFIILDRHIMLKTDSVFTVDRVLYRRGRGLELWGRGEDGYVRHITPHPDHTVRVIGGDENLEPVPWAVTSDYPWAEEVA